MRILEKSRYDFFIPNENKFVEVTGYNNRWSGWNLYYSKIIRKKKYVENYLQARFEFVQYEITKNISDFVFFNIGDLK